MIARFCAFLKFRFKESPGHARMIFLISGRIRIDHVVINVSIQEAMREQ